MKNIFNVLLFIVIRFLIKCCPTTLLFFFFLQSLLAALGSIQFVSNIAFTYFVLKKTVTGKYVFFRILPFADLVLRVVHLQ